MDNSLNKREISRYPESPILTPKLIQLLNQICFRKDDSLDILHTLNTKNAKTDAIFIFGTDVSPIELWATLDPLLQSNISDKIIFTGGYVDYDDTQPHSLSVARGMFDTVKHKIPENIEVVLQEKSKNTLEDVLFSLDLLAEPKSICFVARNFHAGRAYLTLKKYLPGCNLYQKSIAEVLPDLSLMVSRDHWHEYPKQCALVWGEYLRIKKYGERGDIAFEEVSETVAAIEAMFNLAN